MRGTRIRWAAVLAGCALVVVGTVWALQGVGMVGGSVMSGQREWFVIGAVVATAGIGLLYYASAGRSRRL